MAYEWIKTAVCDVCGHRWIPEVENPTNCPSRSCRSRKWNGTAPIPQRVAAPAVVSSQPPAEELRVVVDEYSEGYQPPPPKPRFVTFNGGSELRSPEVITTAPQPRTIDAKLTSFDPRTIPGIVTARNITPLPLEPIDESEDPYKDIPF